MNYFEKAYKEALEKAKARYDKNPTDGYVGYTNQILEEIFPELKESEDELIRKRLINLIKELAANKEAIHTGGYFVDGQDKKYISYLEKQKERGPLSKDEEYTLARIIEYLEDNDCPSKWEDLLHDVYSLPYQKEQKPAEWSEEDSIMIERIVETIQDYAMKTWQIDEETYGTKEPLISYIRFLRSLCPQPHWKPSEEQMNALFDILCPADSVDRDTLGTLYDDLKKL